MVERLEGFCTEEAWKRAYREINDFERQLVDFGTILLKFWVHISKEEQLQRFELRQDTPYKAWKLTSEDWRNREKWDVYAQAVDDMLLKTSTITAPWTVVEGNDKWHARVKTLKTIVDRVSRELEYEFPESTGKSKKKNASAEKNEVKKKETEMGAKNKGKEKLKKKPKKDKQKGKPEKPIIPRIPTGGAPPPGQ